MRVFVYEFGETATGELASLFCMENDKGMIFKVTNYGGIVTDISVPDRNGCLVKVCLGYEALEPYLNNSAYFGALIGRYANRIQNGKFELDGTSFQLYQNDLPHHLHGGKEGFDKKIWDAETISGDDAVGVKLSYLSKDGEEGYPGNCLIIATYELNNNNEISLSLEARSDKSTPINLTQHSYFNLSGESHVFDHYVKVNADRYAPIIESQIPIGVSSSVENTPFDFRIEKLLGDIDLKAHVQTSIAKGFNHYLFIEKSPLTEMKLAATLTDRNSGRMLEVFTTAPGVQFYTSGFLTESGYGPHSGVCFEPQHCPNSINHPTFPSALLHPGETYSSKTIYKFSVA